MKQSYIYIYRTLTDLIRHIEDTSIAIQLDTHT